MQEDAATSNRSDQVDSRSSPRQSPPASNIFSTDAKLKRSTTEQSSARLAAEHSFITDVADVRQMEHGLLQLLDDFHQGKLQAFGKNYSFEKIDQVREQQEQLAKLHFELDAQQELLGLDSAEGQAADLKNVTRLMSGLQQLCLSIQNLHKEKPEHSRS